ncbi:hypothetical protein HW555_005919 [Spodoptera exigua]|uniref:Cytochrome p450 n=1 Tax=Spodoptera exigua TaxID=7107 RepID=A0A835GJK0_SPOEX|nr:hypothetical protein HW555_005919 [Spodoptera exigua]
MLVIILICLIAIAFYIKFRYSRFSLYKFAKTFPTDGDLPILGHTHWFIGGPEKIYNNLRTLVKAAEVRGRVSSIWIGPTLYVVSFNPEDVQKILETCLEKDNSYKYLQAWLGNGLFVAPIDLWKVHRRLMLPIFNNRIIEDYIEVFGKQGKVLVERLQEQVGKPSFDIYQYISSCMMDIVFETSMGKKMDVQHHPDTPYLRARKTVMSIINMRLFKAWLQPDVLFNLTSHSAVQKQNIDATHKFTDEVIQDKIAHFDEENCKEGRKDILQLLLERNLAFSNVELREHIDSITLAGNDTTALVISYALLLLGMHQDAQEEVYKELKNIFGDSQRMPTKEDISRMDYLDRVIKETMRLYTVVPLIGRKTRTELKLSTCTVPAGVGCVVIPMVLHRSKRLWGPDADCFNPDRFLPENCATRHPCAYIPFSYGTRNCIGRHFGMLAMKSVLANVLRSYKVSSEAFDRLKIEILLFPVHGHQITLEKRM